MDKNKKRIEGEPLSAAHLKPAKLLIQKLFGEKLGPVTAVYRNKGIAFFEGAATWIDEGGHRSYIQLKKGFKKGAYLRIYKRDEILAHEMVHVMRAHLNSNKYEEVFAYLTSASSFRRYFGPIFRHSFEPIILLFSLPLFFWTALPLILLLVFFLGRLVFLQREFNYARAQIRLLLKPGENPLKILVRLNDAQIDGFANR